ncbi:MAG: aquaporin [Gemmatimonadales bacterium]
MTLRARIVAEATGTALLVATVVGSGIMAERLSGGNGAVALLANSLATGAGLVAFILAFGPISGAHFNPAVTLTVAGSPAFPWSDVPGYLVAQVTGGVVGVIAANLMFELPPIAASGHLRTGLGQWLSEVIATLGLLGVIRLGSRGRPELVAVMVGCYITAAYWFTASTSFANPAVTIARALTDTFAGIRPGDVPGFVGAQLVAVLIARAVDRAARGEPSRSTRAN